MIFFTRLLTPLEPLKFREIIGFFRSKSLFVSIQHAQINLIKINMNRQNIREIIH